MPRIFIIGSDYSVESMFRRNKWDVSVYRGQEITEEPDFILFTGGSDISPHLYGQENTRSYCNEARDEFEVATYHRFKSAKKLGICRGMQLLNILNGGSMIQDIKGHTGGRHFVKDYMTGEIFKVNSCHHQMCVLTNEMELVAASTDSLNVPEAVWIEADQALGIQGHPEWEQPTEDYFFALIARYFDV